MNVRVFRDVAEQHAQYNEAIKFWSNALGELHHHGQYDITEDELPEPLQRAYRDLYTFGDVCSLEYLVETEAGYGVALLNEYDGYTSERSCLSMEVLLETVIADAKAVAGDPLFAKAEVIVGERTGFEECHELIVVFPADTPAREYLLAAARLDEMTYQACGLRKAEGLDARLAEAAQRESAETVCGNVGKQELVK